MYVMKFTMKSVLMMSLLISFTACGGNEADRSEEEDTMVQALEESESDTDVPSNMAAVMEQAEKALKEAGMEQKKDPVNFRDLKAMLPEKIAGMQRVDESGETTGVMGFTISQAEAVYQGDDGKRIELNIADTGGITMAKMGLAAWTSVTIDREDSNGFERTTTINGHKALEKYSKSDKRGSISIMVDERFVITAEGNGVEMDELREAIDALQISRLRELG